MYKEIFLFTLVWVRMALSINYSWLHFFHWRLKFIRQEARARPEVAVSLTEHKECLNNFWVYSGGRVGEQGRSSAYLGSRGMECSGVQLWRF